MNKLSLIAVLAIALSGTVAFAHKGHEHATGVVRERMELMTDMGYRLLAIGKRLRANKELDRIAADARDKGRIRKNRIAISARQHTGTYSGEAGSLAAMGRLQREGKEIAG
jgi:hypothetical protein